MIDVTEFHGRAGVTWEVWEGRRVFASGPTLEAALIEAEKTLRDDLCDVQARLTAERERLKPRK